MTHPIHRSINFSGGRSSGYMLWLLLQEGLTEYDHVVFTNTGKEREETLRFVQNCSNHWKVPITWVEYQGDKQYALVDYASAARHGEPYEKLIEERGYPPNRVARYCTGTLKVKGNKWLFQQQLGIDYWHCALGIRYDEPLRWGRLLQQTQKDPWFNELPLYEARVTEADVLDFWRQQPFDLGIHSYQGNCDLCFLKGKAKMVKLIRENPAQADWWIGQEDRLGSTFSRRYSFRELRDLALNQREIAFTPADHIDYPCHCNAD